MTVQNPSIIDRVSPDLIVALTMNAGQPHRHQVFESKFQKNEGNIAATAAEMNIRLGDASQQAIVSRLVSTTDPRVEAYGAAMDGILGKKPTLSSVVALGVEDSPSIDKLVRNSAELLNKAHTDAVQRSDTVGAARFAASRMALERADKTTLPKTLGVVMPHLEEAGLRILKSGDVQSRSQARVAFSLVRQAAQVIEAGGERNARAIQR